MPRKPRKPARPKARLHKRTHTRFNTQHTRAHSLWWLVLLGRQPRRLHIRFTLVKVEVQRRVPVHQHFHTAVDGFDVARRSYGSCNGVGVERGRARSVSVHSFGVLLFHSENFKVRRECRVLGRGEVVWPTVCVAVRMEGKCPRLSTRCPRKHQCKCLLFHPKCVRG